MGYVMENPLTVVALMTVVGLCVTTMAVWGTWQMVDRAVDRAMADCDRRIAEMAEKRTADHDEIERLQDRLHLALGRLQRLEAQLVVTLDQLVSAGIAPRIAKRDAAADAVPYVNEAALARQIARLFDGDGVAGLAFELGVEMDNLAGATKDGRVRALVMTARHKGQTADLLRVLERERPNEIWY